jgi:membrane-associated protease RseP (regulator of RpoE activity)
MSDDETPTSGEAPGEVGDAPSAADDTAAMSEPAPASDTDATVPDRSATTDAGTTDAGTTSGTAPGERSGVFVPKWVAVLVGGLVALLIVGGAGFALGRATDDGGRDGREAVEVGPRPQMPGGGPGGGDSPFPTPDRDGGGRGGDGGGGGGGGSGDLPTLPGRGVLLGVSVEPATGDTGDTAGARVAQVVPGSPAHDAGLEPGDVITEVDGTAITEPSDLVDAIQSHDAGEQVTITYERDGDTKTVDVTLGGGDTSGGSSSSN